MIVEKTYTGEDYQSLPEKLNEYLDKETKRYLLIRNVDQKYDNKVVKKYIDLMSKYLLPICFYPYSEFIPNCNRVFSRPNPIIAVDIGDILTAIAVRSPNPAWFIIDRAITKDIRFNTKLKTMFFEDYLFTLAENKLIPSNGIFLDIIDSYKYFLTFDGKEPILDIENVKHDKQAMKERDVELDNGTSKIVAYIKAKNYIF